MAVYKLKSALKNYLWGGEKLKEKYNKVSDDIVAESWLVSFHKDGPSVILNGPYEGMTLIEYLSKVTPVVLGTKGSSFQEFPILVKFLDAKQDLSIQVHPDDKYALAVEGEYGKNEMWIVLEAEENSGIYYGVKDSLTKEEYRQSIKNNTICENLNFIKVRAGDVYYIPAGTIHAVGKGLVICEIQQSSNSTYRVYDFNRVGTDGKLRELHIEKAVDVSNLEPVSFEVESAWEKLEGYSLRKLLSNQYFTVKMLQIDDELELKSNSDSFQAVVVTEGNGILMHGNETLDFVKGDSFFVEASTTYQIKGTCDLVIASV